MDDIKFSIISQNKNIYLINATINGLFVGSLTIVESKRNLNFRLIIVSKEYRNKGIGSKLVKFAINFCNNKWSNKFITLDATSLFESSMPIEHLVNFYKKLGFTIVKERKLSTRMTYKKSELVV